MKSDTAVYLGKLLRNDYYKLIFLLPNNKPSSNSLKSSLICAVLKQYFFRIGKPLSVTSEAKKVILYILFPSS